MNRTTIYARTAQGDKAAQTDELPRAQIHILNAIDGHSTVDDIASEMAHLTATQFGEGLDALLDGGYIQEASAGPSAADHLRKAWELRDKIKSRRQGGVPSVAEAAEQVRRDEEDRRRAEEEARQRAEDEARRRADEELRRRIEEEARRKVEEEMRRKAEDEMRRRAEEDARRKAEEMRRVAEEEARRKAEEEARRRAEEEARRKLEEEARRKTEELEARRAAAEEAERAAARARQEAEEQARRLALEREQFAAEESERARQRAEVQERLLAEEKAWMEAEEKAREEEEARVREETAATALKDERLSAQKRRKMLKTAAMGAVGLVVVALAGMHFVSFDGQIPAFEKALSARFQQPVKIKGLHMALVPTPHLRLDGVTIGADGQVRIPGVKARGDLGNLFGEKKNFRAIELESPVLSEQALGWVLFGRGGPGDVVLGNVSATGVSINAKGIALPPFDARIEEEGGGAWKAISLSAADKSLEGQLTPKGAGVQFNVKTKSFKVPFGSTLVLEDFEASGSADANGINLTDFKGFTHGGTLGGTARLKWGGGWSLSGEVNAKQIDTARVVPEVMGSARFAGNGIFVMQANDPAQLFPSGRVEGNFTIPRGTLLGVDLGSVLQGGTLRGQTQFSELGGSLVYERGVAQFRSLRLNQSNMAATGSIDVDAERNVRGRINAEIKLSTEMRRASLGVSGTLGKLEWQR